MLKFLFCNIFEKTENKEKLGKYGDFLKVNNYPSGLRYCLNDYVDTYILDSLRLNPLTEKFSMEIPKVN